MFDGRLLGFSGVRAALALCCLLALAMAAACFGQSAALASALDALRAGSPADAAALPLATFVGCLVVVRALGCLQDRVADARAWAVADELRDCLVGKLFDSAGRVSARQGAGAFASLAVEGCSQVRTYLRLTLPRAANLAFQMVPLLLCVTALDWVSGVIVAAVVPVMVFYLALLGKQAKASAVEQLSRGSYLSGHFLDSVHGLPTLVAFGRDGEWGASVRRASERFREATMATLKVATLSGAVLDLGCTLAGAAVAVMLGFRLVDGSVSFLGAFTVLLLVPLALAPLRAFASDFHATLDGRESLTRVLELVQGLPKEQCGVGDGGLPEDAESGPREASLRGCATSAASAGSAETMLRCEGAAFSRDGAPILSDVSLLVPQGAKVALVGRSGAGKSTLLSLMAGMEEPCAGRLCSPAGGCGRLAQARWRDRVSFVPQNAAVLAASIRDNVALYRPCASDGQVRRALEQVGLGDLLDGLPDGLDTVVGRGGRALSGGQAQRLALARALVDPDRDVLFLDEPTASVDLWTEAEMAPALLRAMEGRTVVMATHRLSWLEHFDQVVVLEAGRVVAQGAPGSLAGILGGVCAPEGLAGAAAEHLSLRGALEGRCGDGRQA